MKFRTLQVLEQSVLGSWIMLSTYLRKQCNVLLLSLYLILGAGNRKKTSALGKTQCVLGCEKKMKFYFKINAQGNLPTLSTVTL